MPSVTTILENRTALIGVLRTATDARLSETDLYGRIFWQNEILTASDEMEIYRLSSPKQAESSRENRRSRSDTKRKTNDFIT